MNWPIHSLLHHVFVDAALHVLKQLEAFFLVLDQRILLAVSAQPDAFLQVVEAVEMVLPLAVDVSSMTKRSTCRIASAPTSFSFASYFLTMRSQSASRISPALLSAEIEAGVVARVEPEDARHVHLQRVEIPILGLDLLARIRFDGVVEDVFGERQQIRARIDLLDLIAFFVARTRILPSSSSRRSA